MIQHTMPNQCNTPPYYKEKGKKWHDHLRPDASCWRDFRKLWNMNQDRPFLCKSHWKQLMWTQLSQAGSQGLMGDGKRSANHVDGDSDMAPICLPPLGGVGREDRRLRKGIMASASTFVWQKAAPPALALIPDNSVFPSMSLAPLELLPQHWSS